MSLALLFAIDGDDAVDTTLDAFFDANEFDPEEREEIEAKVRAGEVYLGGGGAAPGWAIGKPPAVAAWLAGVGA